MRWARAGATALPMAIGVALGDFTAMTLSMLGLGALLPLRQHFHCAEVDRRGRSRVAGRQAVARRMGTLDAPPRTDKVSAAKMLGHAWLVTALNPKSITFFVAFFLPAVPRSRGRLPDVQMILFETTFLALAFANAFGYALVASRARRFVGNRRAIGIVNRVGGGLLVSAGLATVVFGAGQSAISA